jgi:probable HAF family extracellular repeat protein
MRKVLVLLLGLFMLTTDGAAATWPTYTANVVGGSTSSVTAINNNNQIVGYVTNVNTIATYWYWDAAQGSFEAPKSFTSSGVTNSYGRAINDGGFVIVQGYGNKDSGFLWSPTTGSTNELLNLGGLTGGVHAFDINIHGQIVGDALDPNDHNNYACIWQSFNQTPQRLDNDQVWHNNTAIAINDLGQVAGYENSARTGGSIKAVTWENGALRQLEPDNGWQSEPKKINNSGQIVGGRKVPPYPYYSRAYLWDMAGAQELPNLGGAGSSAWGINRLGQVVGDSDTSSSSLHAFIWQAGKGIADLNDLIVNNNYLTLNSAQAINDRGQIIGYGKISANQNYTFFLTPIAPHKITDITDFIMMLLLGEPPE